MSKLSFKLLFLVQIFQLFFAMSLIFAPVQASAADAQFVPEVPLPVKPDATDRYNFGGGEINITNDKSTRPIAEYIKSIYKYGIGAVGIISAIVLMIGGAIWITAAGSSERISEAKSWIGSSLMGLIIAILAYSILNTINPALVNFKIKEIQNVESMSCCEQPKSGGGCGTGISKDQCKSGWKKGEYVCSDNKCTLRSDNEPCNLQGEYCEKNGKAGWCDKKICQFCKGTGLKCNGSLSGYQCCGGKCESLNGNYICNEPFGSNCEELGDKEKCTEENGGEGYCMNKICKKCIESDGNNVCGSTAGWGHDYECCGSESHGSKCNWRAETNEHYCE